MQRNASTESRKWRVAVLFGGRSGEHHVSVQSARSVIESMDPAKFEVIPIGITLEGEWRAGEAAVKMLGDEIDRQKFERLTAHQQLALIERMMSRDLDVATRPKGLSVITMEAIDVVFPVLHGTYGEDGTVQGLLEMAGKPYVGAGVLASAVGMDKVMMKRIFAEAGLPQALFTTVMRPEWERDPGRVIERIERQFAFPCFVKPANLGSSVGISKAKDRRSLRLAIEKACRYDRKIVIEEFIPAREIEVAVLGNDEPEASVPGEIIASNEFYDYRAKYVDGKSVMEIPANLPKRTAIALKDMAVKAFKAIDCSGLARVDFFVRRDNGEVLINEINTMPGFTEYSMYAKLWENTGLSYASLVEKLIELAFERFREKERNLTKYEPDS